MTNTSGSFDTNEIEMLSREFKANRDFIRERLDTQSVSYRALRDLKNDALVKWENSPEKKEEVRSEFIMKLKIVTDRIQDHHFWFEAFNSRLHAITEIQTRGNVDDRQIAQELRDTTKAILLDDIPRLDGVMKNLEQSVQDFADFVNKNL